MLPDSNIKWCIKYSFNPILLYLINPTPVSLQPIVIIDLLTESHRANCFIFYLLKIKVVLEDLNGVWWNDKRLPHIRLVSRPNSSAMHPNQGTINHESLCPYIFVYPSRHPSLSKSWGSCAEEWANKGLINHRGHINHRQVMNKV